MSEKKETGLCIFTHSEEKEYTKRDFEIYLEKNLPLFKEFKNREENKYKHCFIHVNKDMFWDYKNTVISYIPLPNSESSYLDNYGETDMFLPVETAVKLFKTFIEELN
jgi:hypothetical protein